MKKYLTLLCFSLLLCTPLVAAGDGDSNADRDDAPNIEQVENAQGIILRVDINDNEEENGDSATMRIYNGEMPLNSNSDIVTEFAQAADLSSHLEIPASEVNKDSSTNPNWDFPATIRWFPYHYNGWYRPYSYYGYSPSYYFKHHRFQYQKATQHWVDNSKRHRYYYYPHY